jgi:hypothetical protein
MGNLAGAALIYTAITAGIFARHAGTSLFRDILGGGDAYVFMWNAWWLRQSLFEMHNPYFCDLIFAPFGSPLVWHSLIPLPSAAIALLSSVVPIHVAYNLVVMAAFPLAGTAAFALCRALTRDGWASLVGGLVFMLCPFMASRAMGHLNLLFCGLLPLYFLALLRATDTANPAAARAWRWRLAGVSLCLLFSCANAVVFAANLSLFLFIWQGWRDPAWRATAARFWRALSPTLWVSLPYIAMVLYFSVTYDYFPTVRRDLDWNPEPISYVLPLTRTSIYSSWLAGLGSPQLVAVEPAVYLGMLTFPLAAAGLAMRRRDPHIALCGLLFLLFASFSLGPKLLWNREVVHLASSTVYLPFAIWRLVPVFGAVGQAARYVIISYAMMGVGVACCVAEIRKHLPGRSGVAAAAAVGLLVCIDFAFEPIVTKLPPPLELSASGGTILDPRPQAPDMMYQQMFHRRPIIGGHLARPPEAVLRRYRGEPGLAWFFSGQRKAQPDRDLLLRTLTELDVRDLILDRGDWRAATLQQLGFRRHSQAQGVVVWNLPRP